MIALPGELFHSTQIPACLWFLSRNKNPSGVLFIDSRKPGHMVDRTRREFPEEDIARIAGAYRAWCGGPDTPPYDDESGFCKSATQEEIREHDHVLTPGRCVGVVASENDSEIFVNKMENLVAELKQHQKKTVRLDAEIKQYPIKIDFWTGDHDAQR